MSMSLGEVAFSAYRASVGGKTYDGKPIPAWAELSEPIRQAWQAAAVAARSVGWDYVGRKSFAEKIEEMQTG